MGEALLVSPSGCLCWLPDALVSCSVPAAITKSLSLGDVYTAECVLHGHVGWEGQDQGAIRLITVEGSLCSLRDTFLQHSHIAEGSPMSYKEKQNPRDLTMSQTPHVLKHHVTWEGIALSLWELFILSFFPNWVSSPANLELLILLSLRAEH